MTIRTYPFWWLTPYLVPVFEREPSRLADYLALRRRDWHYVGLIVALMGEMAEDTDHFAAVERGLLSRKRKDVLADVAPDVPAAVLKLVLKLSGELWRPASYRRLAALVEDEHAIEVLRRRKAISRRAIRTLYRLPPILRTEKVMSRLKRSQDVEELIFTLDVVRRIRPDMTEEDILRSLSQCKTEEEEDIMRRWVQHHYQHAPFPAPPWRGNEDLRPITSFAELKRLALEFDNCVRTYHLDVLDGTSYFYRYSEKGRPVATVEIVRLPGAGWSVGDIEGIKNDTVPATIVGRIRAIFAEAGIGAMPPQLHRGSWFRYY
ncbi:hypothetical protein [Parvularcula marina]|uniref:Uncharacterized protein n=1 Tax=Parvularcula marina TaxID=2292771 RepID=A0A371RFC0_9PROT|nr:hypothetical protein [Parvularcula marina]RFB04125.1 hypothetical protein DX908_01820 [Parvularcula marina]